MGVYAIEPGCLSASAAIDKANFARKQVHSNTRVSAVQFDKKLEVKQTLTGELLSGLPQALENGEYRDWSAVMKRLWCADRTTEGCGACSRARCWRTGKSGRCTGRCNKKTPRRFEHCQEAWQILLV